MADTTERNAAMFEEFLRGATLQDLAAEAGVSTSRAAQVLIKQAWLIRRWLRRGAPDAPVPELPLQSRTSDLRPHADFWLAALAQWRDANRSP